MEPTKRELTLDMIPNDIHRAIAEAIGVENLLKVADIIGGVTFYFPQREKLMKPLRDKNIKEECTGYNYLELSQRYGITERWVRELVNTGEDQEIPDECRLPSQIRKQKGNLENQLSLFEEESFE